MLLSEFFDELFGNRILVSAGIAWFAAQFVKMLLNGILNHEWRLERLVGSGGMPSSHAATVCALVVATAIDYGVGSFYFTIAFILAIVVLHDARGVRFETGKQAEAIINLYDFLDKTINDPDLPELDKLKVLVGHTPLQVLAGGAIGIVIGFWYH
ncbi:MAG: divergent PAP2 family protein [Clostridia bacterium]|nr:divergent PAP2 family protein [Clostridia bacterium]